VSEAIKHECGIALIRLLKPFDFYKEKYDTSFYGLNKLYLLMEKQHNRGQDGAGIASVKLNPKAGQPFFSIAKSNSKQAIAELFEKIHQDFSKIEKADPSLFNDSEWLKGQAGFMGELLLGHLRYGTHGGNSEERCHPFLKANSWLSKNLIAAGNFNLTNTAEVFSFLEKSSTFFKDKYDTTAVLETIGHFLEEENDLLYEDLLSKGLKGKEAVNEVVNNLDIGKVLSKSAALFDGGYNIVGMVGHGDAFVMRDPAGIRPGFYYLDDEVCVVASERPAIQTVFNVPKDSIHEIKPGNALVIKRNGQVFQTNYATPTKQQSCSFERIYFSRGSDADIYNERKNLGNFITETVLKEIEFDFINTVFSYIPNTAEVSFFGLIKGIEDYINQWKRDRIKKYQYQLDEKKLDDLLSMRPRVEKIAIKDAKLRTFITQDSSRKEMVQHVYDITYGCIKEYKDTIVIIDDSIVRGTTLKESIIKMLDRLNPKKIIIVSSAPQIRYPDCYGIDMSKMGDFIAFRAMLSLLKDNNLEHQIDEVYQKCKAQISLPKEEQKNEVKALFNNFTAEQISDKIAILLTPADCKATVKIIYQKIEDLHKACPNHTGDWYFTGNYPTPGGNMVVNKAFVNFIEGINERAY
jgi:amidophosphoribosyltransferase